MVSTLICSDLLTQWYRQTSSQRRYVLCPRPVAAISYLARGVILDQFLPIEQLTLVVVHDERLDDGNVALRMAGFSGERVPDGVAWGGSERCWF